MVNAKKKGNAGENNFANWLQRQGIKAYKDPASGGAINKGDINNDLDYTIEVKTVKKLNLQEAWKQVSLDASKARNAPLLAIHYDGMPKDEWLIVLHSNDWVELEVQEKPEYTPHQDPKKKYRLKTWVELGRSILRDMDND